MAALGLLLAFLLCRPAPAPPAQRTPVFVTASFLGKNRLFLEDLSREEVKVYENGQPREVEFFAGSEVPVVYGLLFDRALLPRSFEDLSPLQGRVPAAQAAANVAYQLVDLGLGRQVGWVATYDTEMRLALDFSPDGGRIKDAIRQLRGERTLEESSLYSALFASVKKMNRRNERRRVVILFLEVLDSGTGDKLRPLKNLLSASNIELFIASFASRTATVRGLPPFQSEASLRDLASVTAGDAYFSAMEGIEGLGRRISEQIRTFYTIGFQSDSPPDNPARLKVECTRPGVKIKSHPVVPNLR
jgi:VWFA-related protein